MLAKGLARLLDGREYGKEITKAEEQAAKEAGLVVMFGASDDLVEVRGAISEEYGAYNGTTLHINPDGIVESPYEDRNDCEDCKLYKRELERSQTITAVWCKEGTPLVPWTFETDIPHEIFDIYEDGERFCVGIVFYMSDVTKKWNDKREDN